MVGLLWPRGSRPRGKQVREECSSVPKKALRHKRSQANQTKVSIYHN